MWIGRGQRQSNSAGGFTLAEMLATVAVMAVVTAVAAQLLCAVDRAVPPARPGAAWTVIAAVAIAEDVREARAVGVSQERLVITAPGGRQVVWERRGEALVKVASGRVEKVIPVDASFERAGQLVVVRFADGGATAAAPRAGSVGGVQQ